MPKLHPLAALLAALALLATAATASAAPVTVNLRVEGSAGWPAGAGLNEAAVNALAFERARAVQDYIIKFGIPVERLILATALPTCRECQDANQVQADNRVSFTLVTPSGRRGAPAGVRGGGRRRRSASPFGMQSAGRWTVLWSDRTVAESQDSPAEAIAPVLLRRYGSEVSVDITRRQGKVPIVIMR